MPDDSRRLAVPFHPLADLFPLIEGDEFQQLVADIKANGLLHPVTTLDGMILDGRNRARACDAAGVELRTEPYGGDDPVGFVISENIARRHLDESQRARVAHKLETFLHGGDRRSDDQDANWHVDRTQAASLLNVSPRSIARAAVVDRGIPELGKAVHRDVFTMSSGWL